MRIDRDPIDRAGLDRKVSLVLYLSLLISGTGAVSSPASNRTILLALSGQGSFATVYPADTPAVLVSRTIPMAISGTGSFGTPLFDWYFVLGFAGTGAIATPVFDWQFAYGFSGTGGFLYTSGDPIHAHAMRLDRSGLDRPFTGTTCVNCIPPVLVDRTIPMAISGTGSFAWDFCRLYSLAISGTGLFSTPLFDWQFSYGISGTGQFGILMNRTFLMDLYGTGKFTSEEWTKTIDLYFGGTSQFADPTVFIPVHYLTAAISGTGHFWTPAVLREITNISPLIKGGSVKRSLADKMFTANIDLAINTAHSMMNTTPWQKITFYQPDYLGNFYPVFVGIFPTSRQNITAASMVNTRPESESLVAYDYAWYLAAQFVQNWVDDEGLPHNEQILLTPADQAKQIIHNLAFDGVVYAFKPGMWVTGATSTDYGMIIEINAGGLSNHIRLEYLGGPGSPKSHYFQDNEALKVGGTIYAYADGTSIDETGTITTMYPEDYIKELLGGVSAGVYGANWRYTTGIYPYRMNNITVGWTAMPAIEFPFTLLTTKAQAIEKICQYCKSIFYVKWRSDVPGFTGSYMPAAYLVKQSEIDTPGSGLDLPADAYLTYGGGISASDLGRHIKGSITSDFKGEDQYNWVSVRCQDINGNWLESHKVAGVTYATGVYDPVENPTGTEIKRAYYEENAEIATQSDLNTRADDIYAYYHYQINTWKATFYRRPDLELLQKVIVASFGANVIPDGTYRIIDIQYDYSDGGAKNEVTVTLITDSQFVTYLNLKRVFYNSIYEIQNVVNDVLNNKNGAVYGTVTDVSGNSVSFAVNLNGSITKYYTGIYTGKAGMSKGDRVIAVPDSKGNYIIAISF